MAKPTPKNGTLVTVGYEGRAIEEFVQLLLGAGVTVLIDVRETAWSHKPGFSKGPLEQALKKAGISYEHAAFAGNPSEIRKSAASTEECLREYGLHLTRRRSIVDRFDELVNNLHAAGEFVGITCFERDPDDCHRKILAERWQARGKRRVLHLGATDIAPTA